MSQRIEIKLTATEYDQVSIAARKCGLTIEAYLAKATMEECNKVLAERGGLTPFPTMQLPALPAYPAPLGCVPTLASMGAGAAMGDAARMRQMVAMKRSIDAELIRFAESIIMGQA